MFRGDQPKPETSMKRRLKASVTLVALAAIASPGFAETQGLGVEGVSVAFASEEPGSVIVMRGAETFSLKTGDTLVEGDMVLTRSEGRVTLAYGETCSRELSGLQSLTISADICERAIADVDTSAPDQAGNVSQVSGLMDGTAGVALPALGVLGGIALVAAAASGEDEDQPTSP